MKWNLEEIKKFFKSKYAKPILFFGFYFFFFTIIIFSFSTTNNSEIKNNNEKNIWSNISNNYEYLYEINVIDSVNIKLEGKRYNNKNLFTRKVNDEDSKQIYTFYDAIYINDNDKWLLNNDFVIVDTSFDNKLLDLVYIKKLLDDIEPFKTENNFDGSIRDTYITDSKNIIVVRTNNDIEKIEISYGLFDISLQYRNMNKVKDFVVEK
jgi:hypothetical protein